MSAPSSKAKAAAAPAVAAPKGATKSAANDKVGSTKAAASAKASSASAAQNAKAPESAKTPASSGTKVKADAKAPAKRTKPPKNIRSLADYPVPELPKAPGAPKLEPLRNLEQTEGGGITREVFAITRSKFATSLYEWTASLAELFQDDPEIRRLASELGIAQHSEQHQLSLIRSWGAHLCTDGDVQDAIREKNAEVLLSRLESIIDAKLETLEKKEDRDLLERLRSIGLRTKWEVMHQADVESARAFEAGELPEGELPSDNIECMWEHIQGLNRLANLDYEMDNTMLPRGVLERLGSLHAAMARTGKPMDLSNMSLTDFAALGDKMMEGATMEDALSMLDSAPALIALAKTAMVSPPKAFQSKSGFINLADVAQIAASVPEGAAPSPMLQEVFARLKK